MIGLLHAHVQLILPRCSEVSQFHERAIHKSNYYNNPIAIKRRHGKCAQYPLAIVISDSANGFREMQSKAEQCEHIATIESRTEDLKCRKLSRSMAI